MGRLSAVLSVLELDHTLTVHSLHQGAVINSAHKVRERKFALGQRHINKSRSLLFSSLFVRTLALVEHNSTGAS